MNSEKDLKDIFFLFFGRNQFYALFSHTGTFPLGSRRSLSTYCVYICYLPAWRSVRWKNFDGGLENVTRGRRP